MRFLYIFCIFFCIILVKVFIFSEKVLSLHLRLLLIIYKTRFMVEIKNENGVYTASFEGRLDSSAAKDVEDEIDGLLAHADKEIVLDCTKLEYISSMGLRLFLRIRKEVSAKGGQVSILNINKDVKNVFALTGFDEFFNFHEG